MRGGSEIEPKNLYSDRGSGMNFTQVAYMLGCLFKRLRTTAASSPVVQSPGVRSESADAGATARTFSKLEHQCSQSAVRAMNNKTQQQAEFRKLPNERGRGWLQVAAGGRQIEAATHSSLALLSLNLLTPVCRDQNRTEMYYSGLD